MHVLHQVLHQGSPDEREFETFCTLRCFTLHTNLETNMGEIKVFRGGVIQKVCAVCVLCSYPPIRSAGRVVVKLCDEDCSARAQWCRVMRSWDFRGRAG